MYMCATTILKFIAVSMATIIITNISHILYMLMCVMHYDLSEISFGSRKKERNYASKREQYICE